MSYRLKNSDFRLFLGVFRGKSERFRGVYRRGYRGIFWSVFIRENVPGEGSRSVKKLFINRLEMIKSSSVGCQ